MNDEHEPIGGRWTSVVIGLICALIAVLMWCLLIPIVAALPLDRNEGVYTSITGSFAIFFSVMAWRGLLARGDHAMSLRGWRLLCVGLVLFGLALMPVGGGLTLLVPGLLSGFIYLWRDPTATWLRDLIWYFPP